MHDNHEAARARLLAEAARLGVHELSVLLPQDDGRHALTFVLDVDGERVPLRCLLPVAFPHGELEMFLESSEWHRFAHQTAGGKICPRPGAITSLDATRLIEAVGAAAEWIRDARRDTLTAPDERYELPDFPLARYDFRLLFDEQLAEHERWSPHLGGSGTVTLAKHAGGWVVEEARAADKSIVARRSSLRDPDDARRIAGRWVLCDRFAADGHRVARIWDELRVIIPELDIVLRRAWCDTVDTKAIVLIGAPIRAQWGGASTRIHWQPIVFESYQAARKQVKLELRSRGRAGKKGLKPTEVWKLQAPSQRGTQVPWAQSEDVSRDRLYIRSTPSLRQFGSPLLIGCGALGSALADILVREGLPRIALIDKDIVEYGNLCRLVLHGYEVGMAKAHGLRRHLYLASPSVRAESFVATIPPVTKDDEQRFSSALKNADLVIDASGNESVVAWLSALQLDCQVASVWTNADATIGVGVLTGLGSAALTAAELSAHVDEVIDSGAVPGVSKSSYRDPAPIVPGTGCWHPTFQGSWSRIVSLAAALSDWMCARVRGNRDGCAVVLRFHSGTWQRARSWGVLSAKEAV